MILKIKELKQKAQVKVYSHGAFGEDEINYKLDEEKFAELIIKECINVIEPDDHPVDEINCRYSIIFAIKNHFGIN
jgi:hypothetical protein